jgi:hypothetical protein
MTTDRLSRKERRVQRQTDTSERNDKERKNNFNLKIIEPLTHNQALTFDAYRNDKNLILTGTAGTGKSFLAIYLGINDVINHDLYKQLVIVRSVVPSRDMGFLPGNNKEKAKVYEAPYYAIFTELFGRGDAYEALKTKQTVDFITTSFIRGVTINDSIIVVDEIQNMTASELHTIITRIGKNCKVILAGDIKQNDLNKYKDQSGFADFFKIITSMKKFESIEFNRNDIVRSDLVKEYIITRENLEDKGLVTSL